MEKKITLAHDVVSFDLCSSVPGHGANMRRCAHEANDDYQGHYPERNQWSDGC